MTSAANSPFDLDRELSIAVSAVRAAANACMTLSPDSAIAKADRSPVTLADFTSQALVCAALAASSRITAMVGEERASDLPPALATELAARVSAARGETASVEQVTAWLALGEADPEQHPWFWTLDPIDGTKGFLRGGQWAVALALVGEGEVKLGVLACPRYDGGVLLAARRGGGAIARSLDVRGEAVRLEATRRDSVLRMCESVESGHSDHERAQRVASRLGISAAPLRIDSQAKYAAVAKGDAAVYLRLPTSGDYREKIWDHAAGQIVVEEAGGRVTDVHGAPLAFTHGSTLAMNRGVVAARSDLHAAVIAVLAAS